jgi:hypothetical protein
LAGVCAVGVAAWLPLPVAPLPPAPPVPAPPIVTPGVAAGAAAPVSEAALLPAAPSARIGGRVEAIGPRNRQTFRVRIGPLPSVVEADRALERTLRAGVSEARILVD